MTRHNLANVLIALALSAMFFITDLPDQEALHSTIFSTIYYAKSILSGYFPFWHTGLGLGIPQPFAHHLIYHPLMPLFGLIDLSFALAAYFLFQSLLALYFIRRCCGQLNIVEPVAALCGTTFLLSAVTFHQFVIKVTPSTFFVWTMLPLILFLIHAAIDEQHRLRRYGMALMLGLAGGLVGLNGPPGIISAYAIIMAVYALAYFRGRATGVLVFATIVALVVASDKAILLIQEIGIFFEFDTPIRGHSNSEFGTFATWSLFVKPLIPVNLLDLSPYDVLIRTTSYGGGTTPRWIDNLFVGPPLALAAVLSIISSPIKQHLPLKLSLLVCAILIMFPVIADSMVAISGNIFFGHTVVLFVIFLGGAGISEMLQSGHKGRRMFAASLMWLQVGTLLLAITSVMPSLYKNIKNLNPVTSNVNSAGHTMAVRSATDVAEQVRPYLKKSPSRFLISPGVGTEKTSPIALRKWDGEETNAIAITGVPTLTGFFKGVAATNLHPAHRLASMNVSVTSDILVNTSLLNVMGFSAIAALEEETVSPDLKPVGTLRGFDNIRLYENEDAWPIAVALQPSALGIDPTVRIGCGHDRLLCRDFTEVLSLRKEGIIQDVLLKTGGDIKINLTPSPMEELLLISQAFKADWRAVDGQGNILPIFEILGGMIGVRVPIGVSSVSFNYYPQIRVLAVSIAVALLLGGGIIGTLVLWRTRHLTDHLKNKPMTKIVLPNWIEIKPTLLFFCKVIGISYGIGIAVFTALKTSGFEWNVAEPSFVISFLIACVAFYRLMRPVD